MTATDPTDSMQALPSPQGAKPRGLHRGHSLVSDRMLLAAAFGLVIGLVAGSWGGANLAKSRRVDRIVNPAAPESRALSGETLTLLQSLDTPVQIEFYAPLDVATVPEDVTRFAVRAGNLLADYARASGGKISVTERSARADVSAAGAAGIKPFNLRKGDVSYLGLKLVQGGRSEVLPRLLPAWEPALEADISRAISRLVASPPVSPLAIIKTPNQLADPAVVAEVKRQIPNFESLSLEEGIQILRGTTLKDMQAALSENAALIKAAGDRLAQLEHTQSGAEKQAALKELQRLQGEQAARLGEYATRSSAQIEALRQIKDTAR